MNASSSSYERMGSESIVKLAFIFGVPGMLMQLVQVSYSIVDSVFVGQAMGNAGLAALTAVAPAVLCFIALAMLVSVGAGTLFSMKLGAQDIQGARSIMGSTIFFNTCVSVVTILIVLFFDRQLLQLTGSPAEVLDDASLYLKIYGCGFITQNLGYTIMGFISSSGRPNVSLSIHVLAMLSNVVLDYLFVLVFGWGVAGAAAATVLAWSLGALAGIVFFVRPSAPIRLHLSDIRLRKQYITTSLKYGMPSFLMMVGNIIAVTVFLYVVTYYGTFSLIGAEGSMAIANVVSKGYQVILIMPLGLSFGCTPLFGYNIGAKNYHRIKQLFTGLLAAALVLMILAWLPMMIGTRGVMNLFGLEAGYLELGILLMRIEILLAPITAFECVVGSFLQGTGHYRAGSMLMLARSCLIVVPLMIIFPAVLPSALGVDPIESIYWTTPLTDILVTIIAVTLMVLQFKQLNERSQSPLKGQDHESPSLTEA